MQQMRSRDGRAIARLQGVYFAFYALFASFLFGSQTAYAVEFGTLCVIDSIAIHNLDGPPEQRPGTIHQISCLMACTVAAGPDKLADLTGDSFPKSPALNGNGPIPRRAVEMGHISRLQTAPTRGPPLAMASPYAIQALKHRPLT
ncbi:hypothetical protein [Coralliovum pocilloporae]|uniref:hypothetical protein n=1 Tax=Coralliovum pocilloporae TaxID=3066369 RepID=UPI0033072DD0